MLVLVGLSWGACPVNPRNFKNKDSDTIINFAGPFANLLLVLFFAFLYTIFTSFTFPFIPAYVVEKLTYFFKLGSTANAALAIFNLLPIPPLDGSKVLQYLYPSVINFYSKLGFVGLGIIFVLFGLLPQFSSCFWQISGALANNAFIFANLTVQLIK